MPANFVTIESHLSLPAIGELLESGPIELGDNRCTNLACHLCSASSLSAYADPWSGGTWWYCRGCKAGMTTVELVRQRRNLPDVSSAAQYVAMSRQDDMTTTASWQMVAASVEYARTYTTLTALLGAANLALSRRPENLSTQQAYGWCVPVDRAPSSALLGQAGLVTRSFLDGFASLRAGFPGISVSTHRLRGGLVLPLQSAPGLVTGLAFLRSGVVLTSSFVRADKPSGLLNLEEAPTDPTQPYIVVTDLAVFCGLFDRLRRSSNLGTGLLWAHDYASAVALATPALGSDARLCMLATGSDGALGVTGVTGLMKVARDCRRPEAITIVDLDIDSIGVTSGEWLASTSAESVMIAARKDGKPWYELAAELAEDMGPEELATFALNLGVVSDDERALLNRASCASGAARLLGLLNSNSVVRQFQADKLKVSEHPSVGWSVTEPSGEAQISDFIVRFDEITLVDKTPVVSGYVLTCEGVHVPFSAPESDLRSGLPDFITALLVAQGVYPQINERYRKRLFAIAKAGSTPSVREAVTRVGWCAKTTSWEFPRVVIKAHDGRGRSVIARPAEAVAHAINGIPGSGIIGSDQPPPLAVLESLRVDSPANRVLLTAITLCFHNLVSSYRLGLVLTDRGLYDVVRELGAQLGLVQFSAPKRSAQIETLVGQCNSHDLPTLCPVDEWMSGQLRRRLVERLNVNMIGLCSNPLDAALLSSYPGVVVLAVSGEPGSYTVDGAEYLLPYLLSLWTRGHQSSPLFSEALEFVASTLEIEWGAELSRNEQLICDHTRCHWLSVVNALVYASRRGKSRMPLELSENSERYLLTHHELTSGKLGHSMFSVVDLDLELSPSDSGYVEEVARAVQTDSQGWSIDAVWLELELRRRYEVLLAHVVNRPEEGE